MLQLFAGGWLLVLGCEDIKERKVSVWLLVPGAVISILCFLIGNTWDGEMAQRAIKGLLPGFFVLLLSISTGKVGAADGVVLLILGLPFQRKTVLLSCMIGLFIMSAYSLVLLVMRRGNRDTEVPFIPFLFWGWTIVGLVGGG